MSWIVGVIARVVLAALFSPFPLAWHVNQPATRQVFAPQACSATPHLSSTFLPTYFAAWWDTNNWVAKLQALKADCITNVIIQYSADATTRSAYFSSGLTGWSEVAGQSVLAEALTAADLVPGITVTVGLATNDSWFNVHASPSAMATQATLDGVLADRIWALYSVHRSLRGWYLPLEMDSTNFQTAQSWQTMAAYYGAVTQHLHSLTPGLPVVVAPFFSAAAAGAGGQTPVQWEAMWKYLLAHAQISAIALQDGVGDSDAVDGSLGASRVTAAQLAAWFSATAGAIAQGSPTTQLWDDVDLYSPQDGHPMTTAEILADMKAVGPQVTTFTSFSWFSQLDPAWIGTSVYENAYRYYTQWGKTAVQSVSAPSVTASASDDHTITVHWTQPPSTAGIAGYDVARAGQLIAVVRGATSSNFVDGDAQAGTNNYTLTAFDGSGNLSPAVTVAVATPSEPSHRDVSLNRPYVASMVAQSPYSDNGSKLTDGHVGGLSYGDPAWQGRVSAAPYSFVVDLGTASPISQMSLEALTNGPVGIYLPAGVTYSTSTDGVNFLQYGSPVARPAVPVAPAVGRYVASSASPVVAQWVKVSVAPSASFNDWTFIADFTADSFQ